MPSSKTSASPATKGAPSGKPRIALALGMKHYEQVYPDTDIVLLEPDARDTEMFLANTFSYRQRRELAEHAYQTTRQMLYSRHTALSAKLARHGVSLSLQALGDARRRLVTPKPAATRVERALATLQELMDDLSHAVSPPSPGFA